MKYQIYTADRGCITSCSDSRLTKCADAFITFMILNFVRLSQITHTRLPPLSHGQPMMAAQNVNLLNIVIVIRNVETNVY